VLDYMTQGSYRPREPTSTEIGVATARTFNPFLIHKSPKESRRCAYAFPWYAYPQSLSCRTRRTSHGPRVCHVSLIKNPCNSSLLFDSIMPTHKIMLFLFTHLPPFIRFCFERPLWINITRS